MNVYEDSFDADFSDEKTSEVLIQNFIQNDGYKDIFSEGVIYSCHIQHEICQISKSDGSLTTTTMQIYLGPDVIVTTRDRITVNGKSPKILRVSHDPDSYGLVIFT